MNDVSKSLGKAAARIAGKVAVPYNRRMRGSKVIPLYEQVARRIEQQIESGRFNPGDKIYSIREICEEFAIADVTAKKALRRLGDRGVIRTVTGSGAFVADRIEGEPKGPPAKPLIAFLKTGLHAAPIFQHEIDLIQHELSNLGYPTLYAVAPDDNDVERLLAQVSGAGAQCLIMFPRHLGKFEERPYLNTMRRLNIPLLIIESRSEKDSYVTQDTERATTELAEYLYDIGHRRICLATAFARKVDGFNTALARWKDETVQHWILGERGKTDADSHDQAAEILQLEPRPTAVIAADDHAAAILVGHFVSAGVRVPEDISVVSFGDHPQLARLSPVPITVIRHPAREVAQEVAGWVQSRLEGQRQTRRWKRELTGTLIIRDSSAPPAGAETAKA